MIDLIGEKQAKETEFSANGIQDLSELEVTALGVEDVRALDNGDQIAKVVYTIGLAKSDKKTGVATDSDRVGGSLEGHRA